MAPHVRRIGYRTFERRRSRTLEMIVGLRARKENMMKIKQITSRNRRDFDAVYECEHCAATENGYGYDDDNFHRNVIPTMKCKACGKTAASDYRPMRTKYAAHDVV